MFKVLAQGESSLSLEQATQFCRDCVRSVGAARTRCRELPLHLVWRQRINLEGPGAPQSRLLLQKLQSQGPIDKKEFITLMIDLLKHVPEEVAAALFADPGDLRSEQ